jgi:replication-associated recombination protein RarA
MENKNDAFNQSHSRSAATDFKGLPTRVKTVFELMIKEPLLRKHIILNGPPGSGKTSSAKLFVETLHGNDSWNGTFSKSLFLNSSDERGLEAVRSRVYPFLRSNLHVLFGDKNEKNKPKVIIFDEAETLTDQAQMALRPLLDEDPNKVLIIFLCNSISRIHPSIVHKFLVIQLESPVPDEFHSRFIKINNTDINAISNLDVIFRRGDIRYFLLNPEKKGDCKKIWNKLIHAKCSEVNTIFTTILNEWMYYDIAMFIFFMSYILNILDLKATQQILQYTDSDFLKLCPNTLRIELLSSWFIENVLNKLNPSS